MKDRYVIRLSDNGLHKLRVKRGAFDCGAEVEMAAAGVVGEDEALVITGNAT